MTKLLSSLLFALPLAVYGQATVEGSYQVNYASHLEVADAAVNVTNNGFSAGNNVPANTNSFGDICVNAYVYTPDQRLATCCGCLVSPNSLHSWPISYLLSRISDPSILETLATTNSVVVKLVATIATTMDPNNPFCPAPDFLNTPTSAMAAWMIDAHPGPNGQATMTKTQFVTSIPSNGEIQKLLRDCAASRSAGSQCPVCKLGGS